MKQDSEDRGVRQMCLIIDGQLEIKKEFRNVLYDYVCYIERLVLFI